jgi:hypothetical protein
MLSAWIAAGILAGDPEQSFEGVPGVLLVFRG